MFVSVSIVNAMRHSGLSRRSTKVIVRVSIWTCVCLVLSFLFVYTILLVYVDKHLHPSSSDVPSLYKRVKLQGRTKIKTGYDIIKSFVRNNFTAHASTASHRKMVWNSSMLYWWEESLPECRQHTFFTILVTSSPEHGSRRMAIRNSWCNPKHFSASEHMWKCVFLVGASSNDEIKSQVIKEKALYNDILLGSYVDSYRNLTFKVLHGFSWSVTYCPSSYVIKTDDDCFVNTGLLYEFLLNYNTQKSELYAGSVIGDRAKLKVIRGSEKKWSVSHEEYSEDYYPSYASGIGYIISADTVKRLVSESVYITPISNEDAYVGIVMSHLGINPVSSNRFVLSPSGLRICNFLYVFIVHHVQSEVQMEMMMKAIRSRTKCNHLAITTWN